MKNAYEGVELLDEIPRKVEEEFEEFDWFPTMISGILFCIFLMLCGLVISSPEHPHRLAVRYVAQNDWGRLT